METLLLITGLTAGIAVILLLLSKLWDRLEEEDGQEPRRNGRHSRGGKGASRSSRSSVPPPRTCPLCGAELGLEERVHSDITPPGQSDRIMRIYGCPHCWPAGPDKRDRICPVCKMVLPPEGYAVARYFEQPGRKHIHVLGCSNCRRC